MWDTLRVEAHADTPVAVVKARALEVPMPGAEFPEDFAIKLAYNRFADQVIVIEPIEGNGLPLATLLDLQFMGTSNYEYYGPAIPKIFKLIRDGKKNEAMDEYWKIFPARQATMAAMALLAGTNFLHRMMWKYQGWLQGFNGGPLRAPSMRLVDRQMKALRQGLIASGYELDAGDDAEFFIGRNPA